MPGSARRQPAPADVPASRQQEKARPMIRGLADAIAALLLAPCCACCGRALDQPTKGAVCGVCWASVPAPTEPLCETCGDALTTWRQVDTLRRCTRCRRTPRVISFGRSIGPYDSALREILHALKYGGRRSVAKPLAAAMASAGAEVLKGADFVVPVPLHVLRQYSRGFNQASELARHLGLPVLHALRRTRATVTQTDLPEARRHANVRGAFALRARVPAGTVLVVVDDVSTTGATLDVCAQVLLDGGAKEVRGLTAARAVARLP
jgi:ComF family protein